MTKLQTQKIRPFDAIMLDVGDHHWLYVEQVGKAGGIPALFLHGGPGSGAQHSHRNIFDPDRFHTFLFDQRGAGRSYPYLSLENNDTVRLIDDIEKIRTFFNIEKWIVVGGSWGSTLALAYAQAHPTRVSGMVLRAVFLGTEAEVRWAFEDGPKRFRPEAHAAFVAALSESERARPIAAYINRLLDPDKKIHKHAAEIWHSYERTLSELQPASNHLVTGAPPQDARLKPTPIMEAHYMRNQFFLKPNQLLNGMAALKGIPAIIVQGRYDLLCPPWAAFEVAKRWPDCELTLIDTAGHAMTEPGIAVAMHEALLKLTKDF